MNDQTSRLPAIDAPPLSLLLLEARALAEWPRFRLQTMSLHDLPRGDDHAVMIIPGFGASDATTRPLRRALTRLGYTVCGWEQGRNLGMRPAVKNALALRLQKLHARHGKISLIGWSLGGVFARELARHHPESVRAVYSLGSPINGRPDANNMNVLFRIANRGRPVALDVDGFLRRRIAPPVPCIAIFSKRDGIVAWQCCMEESAPNTENIEVHGSHFGLVCNREVLRVLAERLPRLPPKIISTPTARATRRKNPTPAPE
ncbi:MAG: hypothetical protein JWR16_349 [Nevskia sp.]|nr:hypothetical protein [Nevskia sp.]